MKQIQKISIVFICLFCTTTVSQAGEHGKPWIQSIEEELILYFKDDSALDIKTLADPVIEKMKLEEHLASDEELFQTQRELFPPEYYKDSKMKHFVKTLHLHCTYESFKVGITKTYDFLCDQFGDDSLSEEKLYNFGYIPFPFAKDLGIQKEKQAELFRKFNTMAVRLVEKFYDNIIEASLTFENLNPELLLSVMMREIYLYDMMDMLGDGAASTYYLLGGGTLSQWLRKGVRKVTTHDLLNTSLGLYKNNPIQLRVALGLDEKNQQHNKWLIYYLFTEPHKSMAAVLRYEGYKKFGHLPPFNDLEIKRLMASIIFASSPDFKKTNNLPGSPNRPSLDFKADQFPKESLIRFHSEYFGTAPIMNIIRAALENYKSQQTAMEHK